MKSHTQVMFDILNILPDDIEEAFEIMVRLSGNMLVDENAPRFEDFCSAVQEAYKHYKEVACPAP